MAGPFTAVRCIRANLRQSMSKKVRDMKTLYIYGPPASGKSTVARRLSRDWGRMSIDLDEEIVRRQGRSIPEIFAAEGEAGFRKIERETLESVTAPIVALGGGTLLDPNCRAYAEEHGFVVVLDVDDATLAARVAAAKGTRPLGDKAAERRAHYASFTHHVDADTRIILPRPLRGAITPPVSKSHLHRLLIAEFLAGGEVSRLGNPLSEAADLAATRRCIAALSAARSAGLPMATLDCGESGSTLRFFAPLAAALGVKANFIRRGRLAERPMITYDELKAGLHELRGDISSQFVTGLLFSLPLLEGDSEIRFTTPLQSKGYVEMTLDVLAKYGVRILPTATGFSVPGKQKYVSPKGIQPECDWSGAAFWFAANALGSEIQVKGLSAESRQPDRVVKDLIARIIHANRDGAAEAIDVSECPDNYPALAVVNFALGGKAVFTGTERLRIKESDRLAAMENVFANRYDVDPQNDHRIAMAAAILATIGDSPTLIHNASCVKKSYPHFFDEFKMDLYAVTGWPLVKTRSPELHNAAHAAAGRKAEMVVYRSPTIEEALAFAARCDVKGMAVTIPHKESVMKYLDGIDPDAQNIGAVNTVVFAPDGRKYGYNTDMDGIKEALINFMGQKSFKGLSVILLGAGGAAKAVAQALDVLGAKVKILNRTHEKAVALAEKHGFAAITAMETADLVVNATNQDPIPDFAFTGKECVYDLVYVPEETPLIVHAKAAGCRTENGFSMLRAQANRQLELFCNKESEK